MAVLADIFKPALSCSDNYVVTAGSRFFVTVKPNGSEEGRVWTLSTAAAAANATSVTLTIASFVPAMPVGETASVTLYPGQKLYFGAGPTYNIVTVDAKTTLTGNTAGPVPVQALTSALLATDTCETWAMPDLLLPTNLPLTNADTMVEGTNLRSGLRATQNKVSIETTSQLSYDKHLQDDAHWKYLRKLSNSPCLAFCALYKTGGEIAFGNAIIANRTEETPLKEQQRIQVQVMWQDPYADMGIPAYLSTAEKTVYDRVIRRLGL